MRFCKRWAVLVIVMGLANQCLADTLVRYCISVKNDYILGLISLALAYSGETVVDGRLKSDCTQMRQLDMLIAGELDFMWAGTTKEFEDKLIPIRIPVYKGLMGHRIFLMKEALIPRVRKVATLEELKDFSFGQGAAWADTKILKHAGFNVVTGTRYNNMFDMLLLDRYQLFPRAAHEVWKEESRWKSKGIVVDQSLMLVYPMPAYIFVSPQNTKLATMLQYGLEQAIEDGQFDRYFYSNHAVHSALINTDFSRRKVFYLENPYLPPQTPLADKRLWLDTLASAPWVQPQLTPEGPSDSPAEPATSSK